MRNSSSASDNNGSNIPMRWAPSRIASAAILILIVLGGLAFGIFSIVNHSPAPTPSITTHHSQTHKTKAVVPTPITSSSVPLPASSNQTQLTNTGPGETAIIGFTVATLIGGFMHYGWRKHTRSADIL